MVARRGSRQGEASRMSRARSRPPRLEPRVGPQHVAAADARGSSRALARCRPRRGVESFGAPARCRARRGRPAPSGAARRRVGVRRKRLRSDGSRSAHRSGVDHQRRVPGGGARQRGCERERARRVRHEPSGVAADRSISRSRGSPGSPAPRCPTTTTRARCASTVGPTAASAGSTGSRSSPTASRCASVRGLEAAQEWLFMIPRPALVVADGPYADVAVEAGIEVIAFAGLDHCSLAVGGAGPGGAWSCRCGPTDAPGAYPPVARAGAGRSLSAALIGRSRRCRAKGRTRSVTSHSPR